jgi:phage-related protein
VDPSPISGVKKTISWLDDRGVIGNWLTSILNYIGGIITMLAWNNKGKIGVWFNQVWAKIKNAAKDVLELLSNFLRRLRK